jgi:iron complex outermembrane receptor protein
VRVLLDGFPITETDGRTAFDLLDQASIASIEAIRSNASASWGNASGGVVNFLSLLFSDSPNVSITTTFRDYGYRKESLAVRGLTGSGKYSITVSNALTDGWRVHSGGKRTFVHASMHSLIATHSSILVSLTAANNLFRIPGPLTQSQFDANPSQAQTDTLNYNPDYVTRDERRDNKLGR